MLICVIISVPRDKKLVLLTFCCHLGGPWGEVKCSNQLLLAPFSKGARQESGRTAFLENSNNAICWNFTRWAKLVLSILNKITEIHTSLRFPTLFLIFIRSNLRPWSHVEIMQNQFFRHPSWFYENKHNLIETLFKVLSFIFAPVLTNQLKIH